VQLEGGSGILRALSYYYYNDLNNRKMGKIWFDVTNQRN